MPAPVRNPPHQAIEGIDLAHEVALGEAPNRRVAGHLADGRGVVGDQQCGGAEPGGGRCRLAARVAAPYDDDIVTGLRI